ncbi:hypothetical protein, partial [Pseudomonas aeruginosa]|uniref:hypothetical protein n=1 Tax=Pseudomonas aeruginosa TaxID=287 RepID=UPI00359343D7
MRRTRPSSAWLRAERQRRVGELVLSSEALPGLDEAARSQALLGLVRRKGLELLPGTPELRPWQARLGFRGPAAPDATRATALGSAG